MGDKQELRTRNLEQLLQQTVALQRGDATSQPPSSSESQWLNDAMKDIFSDPTKDMIEVLNALNQELSRPDSDAAEDCVQLIETLGTFVEDINVANDFFKVGGVDAVKACLHHDNWPVQAGACQLVGELTQNNENGQMAVVSHPSLMDTLQSLVVDQSKPDLLRSKAFYAISATVRDCLSAQQAFLARQTPHPLCTLLGAALASSTGTDTGTTSNTLSLSPTRLQAKAAFFIASLTEWPAVALDSVACSDVIDSLARLYVRTASSLSPEPDSEEHSIRILAEHSARALSTLMCARPDKVSRRIKENQSQLSGALLDRKAWIESQNEPGPFEEELEAITQLLSSLT